MSIVTFHADTHERPMVPGGQKYYVSEESKQLLRTNRAPLPHKSGDTFYTRDRDNIYDRAREYLLATFASEWSIYASGYEHVLNLLFESGHENAAYRLNELIEILADDNDVLVVDSVVAFTRFFLVYRPRYPGPAIVSDDNGNLGIQWKIPLDNPSESGKRSKGGILYLKFYSPSLISFIGTLRSKGGSEVVRLKGEASLESIMETIEPFVNRLDW